jgi:putative nucleotidyltransferase with HDIG domain
VGGILHDMGKIVFSAVHPDLIEKITKFSREKEIPLELFEDLAAGLNHAQIGALIAEKWNFPEPLVNAIRYHHEPQEAPQEAQDIVDTVYLANMLCNYEAQIVNFEQIDRPVLMRFQLHSEDEMRALLEKLNTSFSQEN